MGSALNSIVNTAVGMIGAAMGGPIGMMIAQLAKQIIMGVVDKLIDQLPLPQEFKDLLQSAFHAGMGDVGGAIQNANEAIGGLSQQLGGSPAEQGTMQRSVDDFQSVMQDFLQKMMEQFFENQDRPDAGGNGTSRGTGVAAGAKPGAGAAGAGAGAACAGAGAGSAAAGTGGGMPSASASSGASGAAGWIRAIAEALGKQLNELADEMSEKADAIDKEDPKTMVEFQTVSQQFSMLMNTASTAIKTLGEAMASMARKN
jgi:type III secretion apparatus needle protein